MMKMMMIQYDPSQTFEMPNAGFNVINVVVRMNAMLNVELAV